MTGAEATRGRQGALRGLRGAHRRPLLVVAEDGPDARALLSIVLEARGFDAIFANDGAEAIDAVLSHRPDAVVSDMNMPRCDGLALCRAVRSVPAVAEVPIVIWSSLSANEPRVVEATSLGRVEFFSKSNAVTGIDAVLWRALGPTAAR